MPGRRSGASRAGADSALKFDPAFAARYTRGCQRHLRRRLGHWAASGESDAQDVQKVSPVACNQLKPAVAIIAPDDAHLFDAISAAFGEMQDLDVEHVPIDLPAAEQI